MKKIAVGFLVITATLFLGASSADAASLAGPCAVKVCNRKIGSYVGTAFRDFHGAAVRNIYSEISVRHGTGGWRYVDANGDGICDNYASGCQGYSDANGDGICDNYIGGGQASGSGGGQGNGYGGGQGNGYGARHNGQGYDDGGQHNGQGYGGGQHNGWGYDD